MKNRISTLILLVLATQLTFAQVKRAYQDKVFSQTTIIVKQDQASDQEVLDEYDLDDIGMDQVIRITTEDIAAQKQKQSLKAKPEVQKEVQPVQPAVQAKAEPMVQQLAEQPRVVEIAPADRRPKARRWSKRPKKEIVQQEKKPAFNQEQIIAESNPKQAVEKVNQGVQERVTKVRSSQKIRRSKSNSVSSKKKKRKKRKFKKAKRKKFKKKKKYACYHF